MEVSAFEGERTFLIHPIKKKTTEVVLGPYSALFKRRYQTDA